MIFSKTLIKDKEVKELIQKNENLTEQLRQYDKNFNLYLTHISKLET